MSLAVGARPWPGRLAPFWWATQSVWRETFGFRFAYPVEAVPGAGARGSLHYHVHSERLFFDAMELDPDGIPRHRSRTFETYNPGYVAWYGLARLERFLRGVDPDGRAAFTDQAAWLVAHAVSRADGAVVWPLRFDWREGRCVLRAPWISAMVQGLAMSVLVRAHRLTGERRSLEIARAATGPFEQPVEAGGVRTLAGGHALYEEYPGFPPPRVLDGFLFGLLGLWDVAVETDDPRVHRLFADGLAGLTHWLPFWDYRGRWSWYGTHGYLCPPPYHHLNVALLTALARVSGDPALERCARAWDVRQLTRRARLRILLVFLLTKNRCRARYFRWRS